MILIGEPIKPVKPAPEPSYADRMAAKSIEAGISALVFGPPREGPAPVDPPKPPAPPLELSLGAIKLVPVCPAAFKPGWHLPHHLGFAQGDQLVSSVALCWLANTGGSEVGKLQADEALTAARARLEAIRKQFVKHELYKRWKQIAAQLQEAREKVKVLEPAPDEALRKARNLILLGQDPAPAEAEYAELAQQKTVWENRVRAFESAESVAKRNAEGELARQLEVDRAAIEAAAAAEALKIAEELTRFVTPRIEALIAANKLAGVSSSNSGVAGSWGIGNELIGPYRELP